MKEVFVVGGLDTSEKKQEAETLLEQLGYRSDEYWNKVNRDENRFTFISIQTNGSYAYHSHDCEPKPLITLTQLRSKAMKTDNVVIKSVTEEDGPRIIEYFKSIGVDTEDYAGSQFEEDDDVYIYYGVIDGKFNNYRYEDVVNNGATIIGLPTSDKVTWTREQFKSLHDMACNAWKPRLVGMFPKFTFQDVCEITEGQYIMMYGACTANQAKLMDKIFGNHPFKKKVMFMCTKTLDDAFTKGKEYELVRTKSDGYVLVSDRNNNHTVTVGEWADYFYKID